ncbi:hypothetical protein D3C87_1280790 [compost metagenome]
MQIRSQRQGWRHADSVVQLHRVFGVRRRLGVSVLLTDTLGGLFIHLKTTDRQADLILRARGKRTADKRADVKDFFHVGHVAIRLDEVGEQGQAANAVVRVLINPLLGHRVIPAGLIVLIRRIAGQANGLAIDVVIDIVEITGIAPDPRPIAAGQTVQGRRPRQLANRQITGGARRTAEVQALGVFGKAWIDLVQRGIERQLVSQFRRHRSPPLADGPGEPIGSDVTRHRAAERQVLKLAGKREHIATHWQTPEFHHQSIIQQRLLVIELHQAGNAAVAVDFLGSQQRVGPGLGGQTFAIAVAQGHAKTRPLPAHQLLQIKVGINHQLIAVSPFVLVAALGVVGQFVNVGQLKIHALIMQASAFAVPVPQQKIIRRVTGRMGTRQCAGAQKSDGNYRFVGHYCCSRNCFYCWS